MKIRAFINAVCMVSLLLTGCSTQKTAMYTYKAPNDPLLPGLMSVYPQYFDSLLRHKDELGIKIIYTRVDRNHTQAPWFTQYSFNTDTNRYFYPASTVKFPVALLALQKLNELNIPGLDMNTTMITGTDSDEQTEAGNDPTAADGRPTIAHYIKKILLVSDNDAFNRLYEFLGQEYINNSLHRLGYTGVEIIHRLSISLSEEQNRHTNPVRFTDSNGNNIYEKPPEKSKLVYVQRESKPASYRMGKGYIKGDELVNEPFDFSGKNKLPLESLHLMMLTVMFPEAVPPGQRFLLLEKDRLFLQRYMSMRPGESNSPVYPQPEYWDNYVKMFYYGSEKTTPDTNIRIFNKTGTAYGFLIDAAYIVDYKNKIEFMLSAVIYCNSDGIFNDDKYDYENIGHPFLKNLGRVVYEYELKRKRIHPPDLSAFHFEYR